MMEKWRPRLAMDRLIATPFMEQDFVVEFLASIPEEEQFKYVENTNNYHAMQGNKHLLEFDPQYVIVTRRAVPSKEAKPEQFWTDEYRTALRGLKYELPAGTPSRTQSIIMVTTLQKLNEYGVVTHQGGTSDGEICIRGVPFKPEDFLFVYKPHMELGKLSEYIQNGGMKNSELVAKLKDTAKERQEKYGFYDNDWESEIPYEAVEASTEPETIEDINCEIRDTNALGRENGQQEAEWAFGDDDW